MTDTQQLINELILHAESGEHVEFHFIRTLRGYFRLRRSMRALKAVLKVLTYSTKTLFNTYCQNVEDGTSDVSKLIAFTMLDATIAFYERDLHILTTIIGEYETYLISGNLFDFIWYGGRPEKKLWDHRRFFDGEPAD